MEIDLPKLVLLLIIPFALFGIAYYLNHINKPKWVIRKLIHLFGLTIFGIYGSFLETLDEIIITLLSFLIIFLIFSAIPQIQLFRTLLKMGTREGEREAESFINTILTSIIGLSLLYIAIDDRWFFLAGILAVALGDGLGEFIGKPYGNHKYEILSQKSIEGSLGVFFGTLSGILFAYITLQVGNISSSIFLIFLLAAAVAMIIEGLSVSFLDNILLPYSVAGVLWYYI